MFSPKADFAFEILTSSKFLVDFIRRKPGTRVSTIAPSIPTRDGGKTNFSEAFGLEGSSKNPTPVSLRARNNNVQVPYYIEEGGDPVSGGVRNPSYRAHLGGQDDDMVRLTNVRHPSPTLSRPSDDTSGESAGLGSGARTTVPQRQQGYGRTY